MKKKKIKQSISNDLFWLSEQTLAGMSKMTAEQHN